MAATVFFASSSELATLTNVFAVDGTPTDPTTVSLAVTDPTGAPTTYTYAAGDITKTATGTFRIDVATPTAGEWQYVWTGTGTASDVVAGSWTVLDTTLGHLYCTPQMLLSRLGLSSSSTQDLYEIHQACFSASRAVEALCDRTFYRTLSTEVRTFEPHDWYCLELGDWNDLVSVTTLKTDPAQDGVYEVSWTEGTDFELRPRNTMRGPERRPYTQVRALGSLTFPKLLTSLGRRDLVQITGVYGWPAVPAAVAEATRIMAAELFKLKDAPFGVAAFGEYGAIRVRENPKVAALLLPYMRNPVVMA